jgi:hypothetical protein
LTSQGHPRTVFHRALEHGNLLVAEATAREVGQIDLREALELTALVARNDQVRGRRMAARWLERWLGETAAPMIDEAVMVAGCLAALGGASHTTALAALRGVSRKSGLPAHET